LFEEISRLPEYYLTRAEQALLDTHVPRWITALRPRTLVELGAGSAAKTRIILDAMWAQGKRGTYVPVDISADFLEQTAGVLRQEYPGLRVAPVVADFACSFTLPRSLERPTLLTFLGSTIGNFTVSGAAGLLRRIGGVLQPGDRFLLGTDLRKEVAVLEAAYNDARGVTAEFNLNLLRVLERDFGAEVDVDAFLHRAFYDPREHRIEMHLVSTRPQVLRLPGVGDVELREGEMIRTEISCKYDRQAVLEMLTAAGFVMMEWQPDPDSVFALSVAAPERGRE
jgi:L-histidine Nalpha-methyltransferase